jgi:hypothetical protein
MYLRQNVSVIQYQKPHLLLENLVLLDQKPIRPLSAIELLVDGGGVGMDPPDTAD